MNPLFPYQAIGAEFLASKNFALLADEMGLGKTVQAIRGLDRLHATRALIISPSVARINWAREFDLWSSPKPIVSVLAEMSEEIPSQGHVICSFNFAAKNVTRLREYKWDALIVDEAHMLKSSDAERSKAILGAQGVAHSARRTWLLTGTPTPNAQPGELWIMLYAFGVTKLPFSAFINYFSIVRPTSYGMKEVSAKPEKIPELKQLLAKIMLRRLKKDVMKELPPISYGHVNVEPGLVDLEITQSFTQFFLPTDRRKELNAELNRQQELLTNVVENMKSKQGDKLQAIASISDSVSTLRRYIGLQKCEASIEIITKELEAKAYEKIVIFAIHRDVIENMRLGLRKFGAVVIYGNTDPAKRQKNIDRFQNNPKCRVFIGNIHAAGTAITLTKAHHVTFVEQDWVPGNNAQAVMRCHRIGQENPVSVRFVVLDGTLDAKIGYILKRKTEQLTQILD